ncbi:hypothetical protein [Thermus sediminis]|uniref:hypothetical protein n=1 Tax=Thermus sediminis TaxID=1761908 RepID=UPI000E3D5E80|nr:hypothetical protein [Thermus sediminis]
MPRVNGQLVRLALERFGLSTYELASLMNLEARGILGLADPYPRPYIPFQADLLAWLLSDEEAQQYIRSPKISVNGIEVRGHLHLEGATVLKPAEFNWCDLRFGVSFRGSKTSFLTFISVWLEDLLMDGARVEGHFTLLKSRIDGVISADFATIEGDFRCKEVSLNPSPRKHSGTEYAMHAPRIQVGGNLELNDLKACAPLSLLSAKIGGQLILKEVEIKGCDASGIALQADYVRGGGPVYLERVICHGAIQLAGSEFAGQMVLRGVKVRSSRDPALAASGIRVRDVLVRDGFSAEGGVRLDGGHIEGSLNLSGLFSAPEPRRESAALDLSGSTVASQVVFDTSFHSKGKVRMVSTRVAISVAFSGTFENPNGEAIEAIGMRVGNSVGFTEGFSVQGLVRLYGAEIVGTLKLEGARWAEGDDTWLDLRNARIGTLADSPEAWPSFDISGAVYENLGDKGWTVDERIRWLGRQRVFSPQTYAQLAQTYWRKGEEGSAVKVLIAKQNERLRRGGLSPASRLGLWVAKVTMGYGYRSHYALLWFIALVLMGWTVYTYASERGYLVPSATAGETGTLYPLLYSLDVALPPLIDLHQERHWALSTESPLELLLFFWLQIFLGWVLTTLFLASISGLVRRLSEAGIGDRS